MTQRYCRVCNGWHDLNEVWPRACGGHFKATIGGGSVQIIKDIEPYIPIAADTDGKRHAIGGRRQHREFLQRNKYVEVGNETPKQKAPEYSTVTHNDVRRAVDEVMRKR